ADNAHFAAIHRDTYMNVGMWFDYEVKSEFKGCDTPNQHMANAFFVNHGKLFGIPLIKMYVSANLVGPAYSEIRIAEGVRRFQSCPPTVCEANQSNANSTLQSTVHRKHLAWLHFWQ